jgi:sec-independent protein translocase protein TatC
VAVTEKELTVVNHLHELRRVFIVSIVSIVVIAVGMFFVADFVLRVITDPVTNLGHELHVLHITEALMAKLKLSLFLGFIAALPVVLWQVWGFVLPALKKDEKKHFTLFVIISYMAFIAGLSFAFFLVFHLGVAFLLRFAGDQLLPMLTIGNYVSFTITFLLPFGLVFQLPLASFLLAKMGIISQQFMKRIRKHALLVIVIISAMLTPADILTCIIMAAPMYSLFELSIWIVGLVEHRKARVRKKREEAEESSAS